jgi:DNA-directed RNA polymerase subunit RPC12/RpoP
LSFARSFQCYHCNVEVSLDAPGTSHRNHCPRCLWSRHLDQNTPGDRKSGCPGGMEPIAVTVRGEHRWVLIHRCTHCGRLRLNRTAADDNMLALMQIAALPLAMPPFPYGVQAPATATTPTAAHGRVSRSKSPRGAAPGPSAAPIDSP